ncbi:MAG: RsmE family RNA methyltransferase [Gemmatimonadetes bacterium]|nr:RsmE family RNA methyltransferase [Gemmatimonadota bacterium]
MITVLATPGTLVAGAELALEEEEQHHLTVRRAREGEAVMLLDGAGCRGTGQLRWAGKVLSVAVDRVSREPRPPAVTLAVGAGDRERFALLAEQAVQLGATRIVPIETDRTANVATRVREGTLDKVRRRSREALKQCSAAWECAVAECVGLEQFLAEAPQGACWLADHAGSAAPSLGVSDTLTVLVGPEGGFTATERDRILSAAWVPVALGPHILRYETAALAALSTAWQARHRGDG